MAKKHQVTGWVLNAVDGVHIHVEGEAGDVDRFALAVANEAPAAAHVAELNLDECPVEGYTDFEIRFSEDESAEQVTLVSPDLATCDECVAELFDPENRRYRYPFINCTNCGPRFTIIGGLPYDRAATSMAPFEMCPTCAAEYTDPADRRFHAQPDACFDCGPHVSWRVLRRVAGAEGAGAKADDGVAPSGAKDDTARGLVAGGVASSQVRWGVSREASDEIFASVCALLRAGGIVAVKGLGGFHLACDADNPEAVAALRQRKHRDGKAFAVMMATADDVAGVCCLGDEERAQLTSPARPIVLLRKRADAHIGVGVADKLPELGVMLPATPVQHLIMHDFVEAGGRMLVMTSGNLHDEPIVVDDDEAADKLSGIADAILGNDRAILSRYDDSVVRVMDAGAAGRFVQVVRRARGFAPAPIAFAADEPRADTRADDARGGNAPEAAVSRESKNDVTGEGLDAVDATDEAQCSGEAQCDGGEDAVRDDVVLAVGPEQKNTLTLLEPGRAFVSQHVGDLEDAAVYDAWLEAKRRMQELFRLEPTCIAADMHPSYLSSQWAASQDLPVEQVQHHHAHIVSVMAENGLTDAVCGIAFDGTGYGVDGAIWGGEVMLSNQSDFERFANFSYVPMPGGASAIKNPLRMAYGVLWEGDLLEHPAAAGLVERLGTSASTLDQMIDRGINTPYTSSVGRLFDAASALLGVCEHPSYQGEGAILLEAAIELDADDPDPAATRERYAVKVVKNNATPESTAHDTSVLLLDPIPTFEAMLDDMADGLPVGTIAARFHDAIVGAVVQSAQLVQALYGISTVALAGGVFMNRYIMEHAVEVLCGLGFTVAVSRELPPNDGSVSFGQAVVTWRRKNKGSAEQSA